MPLPFNRSLDLKLLELVKDNPILYHTKHSKYLDFDSREVVWQKIGDALNRPAVEFAGIQCQAQFEDFQEDKHKPGFIENLNEFLPATYCTWGVEKKVLKAHRKHQGLSQLEAKNVYIKTARDLPTYGVTFFLVKEKQHKKKKLIPRLLGINAQAILRMDENTKEILQQWPLTHVKSYHVGKSETFTLDFGDYSDKEYCCKTQDVLRIRDILEGYIDLIRRRMLAGPTSDAADSMPVYHDSVQPGQSNIIQLVKHRANQPVSETFVGPTVIIPYSYGSAAQQGTQMMTMQQVIASNQFNNPQKALKGEVAQRSGGDLSRDCVRKLKRMNSSSIKIVTLLAEPSESNLADTQHLTHNMKEDLVDVDKGMKAITSQQTIEESRQMLQNEMLELTNFVNQLSDAVKPGHVNTNEAKDAAEKIVSLTTEMYLAQDPKSKRNSQLLDRSRGSFRSGEQMDESLRRASFLSSAGAAHAAASRALLVLDQEPGPALQPAAARQLELALQRCVVRLNAALALHLTAHADPNNIDYAAAIDSMNTINELMPEIAQKGVLVAGAGERGERERRETCAELRALVRAASEVAALSSAGDREKMREVVNNYANTSGKLMFKIVREENSPKENEMIALSRACVDKTSLLLRETPPQHAAAAARLRAAAQDLLTCAQLTAGSVSSPHCRSALAAALEHLACDAHRLAAACRASLEGAQATRLHARELELHTAVDRLRDACEGLGGAEMEDESVSPAERQRLQFVSSVGGARDTLSELTSHWDKGEDAAAAAAADAAAADAKSVMVLELKEKTAAKRLARHLAQLNGAVAALALASDGDAPAYSAAAAAVDTIAELMPAISEDARVASARQDAGLRAQVAALGEAARALLDHVERGDELVGPASKFSAVCSKLVFLISPDADKGREKKIGERAAAAYDANEAFLVQAHEHEHGREAAARAERAARDLVTVAQITAPSIEEVSCSSALASAMEHLRTCSRQVAAECHPRLEPESQQYSELQDSLQHLEDNVKKLAQTCGIQLSECEADKKRLQFVSSVAEVVERLESAEQQTRESLACVMMKPEDASCLKRQLGETLGRINATAADLAVAAADRQSPDYESAQRAVQALGELMPVFVQETCVLGATRSSDKLAHLQHQLRQLCGAARQLGQLASTRQSLSPAAAKFSEASGNLTFLISPGSAADQQGKLALVAAAGTDARALAAQLARGAAALAGGAAPRERAALQRCGGRLAAEAQALRTVAQMTAPTITSPSCSKALVSAAERLQNTGKELVASCQSLLEPGQEDLPLAGQQLDTCLERLVQICKEPPKRKSPPPPPPPPPPRPQHEQLRLQFADTVAAARSCCGDMQQLLNRPVMCAMMREEDGTALQHQLQLKLAQLNAAVATLATATSDRSLPDYAAAQRAVSNMAVLLPQLVRESRTLCGTKDVDGQQGILEPLQQLCDACTALCEGALLPQAVSEAAAKLSDASGKLMFSFSQTATQDQKKQHQIIELSAISCGRASELLTQVQALTLQVDSPAAADLDTRGARTADAAQALLTVAQVTAPSISSPQCQSALGSAVQTLRVSAVDLTIACDPHLAPGSQKDQLADSHQRLGDSLDALMEATGVCTSASPHQLEKRRMTFIRSLAEANNCFEDVQRQLLQPAPEAPLVQLATLRGQLQERLDQLNAAVATLAAATADRSLPDYTGASRAVASIAALLPPLVQDARTLSGAAQEDAKQTMLEQIQQLCDAARVVCETSQQPQSLSEATEKFAEVSSALAIATRDTSATDVGRQQEVVELAAACCGRAGELLAQVQALTQLVQHEAAADLDTRGASTADAAQALLSVAQVTAPSISSPECRSVLEASAEKLRASAGELQAACKPHLREDAQRQQLRNTHQLLLDSLNLLLQHGGVGESRAPAQQEGEVVRLKFIRCVSSVSPQLELAEDLLAEPAAPPPREVQAPLQHAVARRLALLNVAVAELAAATTDHERPDYAAAERSIITISEIMPKLLQDAKTLSYTESEGRQREIQQHLKELHAACRRIFDNADDPKKLNESSIQFALTSSELVRLVAPSDGDTCTGKVVPPPTRVTMGVTSRNSDVTQDFLDALRADEETDIAARSLHAEGQRELQRRRLGETAESVCAELTYVEEPLLKLQSALARGDPAPRVHALEAARRERRAEEALGAAAARVASLLAACHTDKFEYSSAQQLLELGEVLRTIVEDGSAIVESMPEKMQKPLVDDLMGLCEATRTLCQAAKDDKERVTDACVAWGERGARVAAAVGARLHSPLQTEVTSSASAIGSSASRLAREAAALAGRGEQRRVQGACAAGVQCVDAATKLVLTAKLIAPTIHHRTCQDALMSSADTLSSNMTRFSNTWQPLASELDTTTLGEESGNLMALLETLRANVEGDRLGKTTEGQQTVVVDTPLRQMTVEIIDNARSMMDHGELSPEGRQQYSAYCDRLTKALRNLDFANARCQRAPHDANRRYEMEVAIQELQTTLLQTRPARAGHEQNNIVDFRDFLQGLVTESDHLARTADKHEAATGKRTADDLKILCSKISEDASKLMSPTQSSGHVDDSYDDINGIDEFAQECGRMVGEARAAARGVREAGARRALTAAALPLALHCTLLRFASSAAVSTAETAAFDAALQDLDHFRSTVIKNLATYQPDAPKEARGDSAGACAPESAGELLRAAGRVQRVRGALAAHAVRVLLAAGTDSPRVSTGELPVECVKVKSLESEFDLLMLADGVEDITDVHTYKCKSQPDPGMPSYYRDGTSTPPLAHTQAASEQVIDMIESQMVDMKHNQHKLDKSAVFKHLEALAEAVENSTQADSLLVANWMKPDRFASTTLIKKAIEDVPTALKPRLQFEVIKHEDVENLLTRQSAEAKGNRSCQMEDKFDQLCTKLASMSSSLFQSINKQESAARSLHATADAAVQLASAARALTDEKKPVQSGKIEDAAHEMCLSTYNLLKVSEILCQNPNHHDTRRRLLEACYHLNHTINKLSRTVHPDALVPRECSSLLRALQLRRGAVRASARPLPAAASPYAHATEALQSQRDVLVKLNSDEAMSREDFLKGMLYITTAVTNSTECAAQAVYLLSVYDQDKTAALEGIVDVPKMQKLISSIHDACVSVVLDPVDQVKEEKKVLEKQIEELLEDCDKTIERTRDPKLKTLLTMCKNDVQSTAKAFYNGVDEKSSGQEVTCRVLSLDSAVQKLGGALDSPGLVPTAGLRELSADRQALCDDILKHSTTLVTDTEELLKQIKSYPEQQVMNWSSYSKRRELLITYEALIKSIKASGQSIDVLEADVEQTEQKSYLQKQTETAFKWLHKPMAKSDVKANGQQAVRNLLDVGNKMLEDLSGGDREDLRHVLEETEQLLTHCCKKYDQEQYSLLMERIRELRKAVERLAITRVVEDFMDAEEPLADLDILADAERDPKNRQFILERKIAELLAQLGRVRKTAIFIADTGAGGPKVASELRTCTQQTELLAPLLVKTAEERIHKADDKAMVEQYQALLAQYTAALGQVRALCDESLDPLEFVQAAGDTMQQLRDQPQASTGAAQAISRLAARVIHVGLSSRSARADPSLRRALGEAQLKLRAAAPAPDARASRLPDWRDTTAKILNATGEVESALGGENIFNKQPEPNEPIYNEALNLHVAIREWSSRDNEIVAVAKRMAVLMAKLSAFMQQDKQRDVLTTSKSIVAESLEVTRLARKLAHECPDHRIKDNLLQVCVRIPTVAAQLKMLTSVKGSALGRHGRGEDRAALDMLVGNAQGLMASIQDVVKAAASASVKIMSQRGSKIKWVRKTYY